jgi:hypothetical protein
MPRERLTDHHARQEQRRVLVNLQGAAESVRRCGCDENESRLAHPDGFSWRTSPLPSPAGGAPFVNFNPVMGKPLMLGEKNKAVSHRKYRIIAADRMIDAAAAEAEWRKWMGK